MKKLLIFYIFLLSISNVLALGISPAKIEIEYVPGYSQEIQFQTDRRSDVGVYIEGSLSEFLTVKEDNIAKDGTFIVEVSIPDVIEQPGTHTMYVGLIEKQDSEGMVAGIASIRTPIKVKVPYDGIYVEVTFHVADLNNNETQNFYVSANNLGNEGIKKTSANVKIIDSKGNEVGSIDSAERDVPPRTQVDLPVLIDASNYGSGNYVARAYVSYDGNNKDLTKNFKIGELTVRLNNYTDEFVSDSVEIFELDVESVWNDPISNVFAQIDVSNSSGVISSFKTVSFSLDPWERKKMESFWDTKGIAPEEYKVSIKLNYQGESSSTSGKIVVAKGASSSSLSSFGLLSGTNLLIILIIALIVLNVIVLSRKKKK